MKITATDLIVDQLEKAKNYGFYIPYIKKKDAQSLSFEDQSFEYEFVNSGLYHLMYPHVGSKLLRCTKYAIVFIEAQDTIFHIILGKKVDFEPADNHVYRWTLREIDKFYLSANIHAWATKTAFMPVY